MQARILIDGVDCVISDFTEEKIARINRSLLLSPAHEDGNESLRGGVDQTARAYDVNDILAFGEFEPWDQHSFKALES